ncbi:MAG: PAS domain S-box protein [Desulfobacterales bacterium]|nr:MAG: PAS domain S-box protein [Desulfobacterales bacterium]
MNPIETLSPLRILLVEDDEHDRIAFRRSFEKSLVACEITECTWAEDALLQLLADVSLFDVVVIDHKLPAMSGLDLCKELLDQQVPLPLVLLTGKGSQELAVEALKAGVCDYIIKQLGYLDLLPVVLPQVVQKHGDHVARKRAEEALIKAYDELEQRVEERTTELARTTEQLKRELTERKRTEQALRESEERYGTLVENSLTGIYMDQDSKIVFANRRFAEIFGYSKEELADMESWKLVHPEDRPLTDAIRAKRVKGEEAPAEYEARGLTKDGKTIWVLRRNTLVEYQGKPAILGNVVDVTERKRTEEALWESKEKYHTLFDYDPNSIFVLDPETFEVLDVNVRALEVYGYEKEELIGKRFKDLGDYVYSDGFLSSIGPTPSAVCSVYPKIRHRRKDGTPIYVNVHACSSKGGHKGGIIATTVDITESLEKETQLIQASKMSTLGEMATGVAHELNQPLSAIQIGADFFQNIVREGGEIPLEELALVSEQIASQVARAVSIINHMREFGRKTEIQREKVDINEPLRAVFALLGEQLRVRGVKLLLDLQDDLPPVFADSNRLEQVFIDLVVNARDAMEEGKERLEGETFQNTLKVKTFREDSQVVVTIADTGPGIPDDVKEKIFEPFFTTKEVGKGTGLGLSISYGIVKDYDGTIEVESEVDKGTTFKITFPACDEGRQGS